MAIGDLSFAFDPSKESPESVRKKREIVAAILATNQTPANLGQGLNALGEGITANVLRSRAEKGQAYGDKQAADTMAGLFGGNTPAPASSPSMGVSGAPSSVDISGDKETFISSLMPAAIEASKRTGVDPRIIVAQAAQETGWGKSAPGNNFFGIKSHGKPGGQNLATKEVIDGQTVGITDSFRTFDSPEASVMGYADFLLENPRYKPMMEAQGLEQQLAALGQSGYATDPNYAQSVGSIAQSIPLPDNFPQTGNTAALGGVAPQQENPVQAITSLLAGQQQPQAMQTAQGPSLNQLYQAAQNSWLNEGQQGVINALIQQQTQANDPLRQLQLQQGQLGLEKSRLELDQMRSPQQQMTAEQQNLAWRAQQAGLQPGTPEYQEFILGGGKGPMVSVNVGEGDKFFEELDKKNAQMFSDLSNAGAGAQRKLMQIDRLAGLLEQSPTGGGAAFKQALGNFGINTEGLSEIQAAQALINELVPQQRPAGSGPMSDADLELFKQSLPRIINQPGGNETILQTMRGIAEYEALQGQIADAVSNREISPAEGRKRLRELSNPLEGFSERTKSFKAPEPQQEPQGAPQPGQVVDGWRFKGGDPSDQNNWEQI